MRNDRESFKSKKKAGKSCYRITREISPLVQGKRASTLIRRKLTLIASGRNTGQSDCARTDVHTKHQRQCWARNDDRKDINVNVQDFNVNVAKSTLIRVKVRK